MTVYTGRVPRHSHRVNHPGTVTRDVTVPTRDVTVTLFQSLSRWVCGRLHLSRSSGWPLADSDRESPGDVTENASAAQAESRAQLPSRQQWPSRP